LKRRQDVEQPALPICSLPFASPRVAIDEFSNASGVTAPPSAHLSKQGFNGRNSPDMVIKVSRNVEEEDIGSQKTLKRVEKESMQRDALLSGLDTTAGDIEQNPIGAEVNAQGS
jgi:hypothetical protein